MSGPEEQLARTLLRASHADREQVVGLLKMAFVQGRLTQDEFDGRVSHAFAARTYAELTRLTDDLPVTQLVTLVTRSRPGPDRGPHAGRDREPHASRDREPHADRMRGPHAGRPCGPHAGPGRGRAAEDAGVQAGGKVIASATVIAVLLWVVAIVTFSGPVFLAALGATATAIVASVLTGGRILVLWIGQLRAARPPA